MKNNEEIRNKIIKVLNYYNINYTCNKDFCLLNDDGRVVDFRKDKDIKVYNGESFEITINYSSVDLKTTYNNQLIDDEWMEELNKMVFIKDIIQTIIDVL